MSVSCECCVMSSIGLCDGPINRPEDSTQCVESKCEGGTSAMRRSWISTAVDPLKKQERFLRKTMYGHYYGHEYCVPDC